MRPSASWRMRVQDPRLGPVDGGHGHPQLLGHLGAAGGVEGQSPEGPQRGRLELLLHRVQQAAEHVAVVLLVPLPVQVAVGVGDLLEGGDGAAAAAGRGAGADGPPVIGRAAADDGAQPGAERAPLAGVLEGGEVLDDAQEDVLAEVLQVDRRHALSVDPADDQGTIQVRQVLPGTLFAGLGAEQQALPGLVHDRHVTTTGAGDLENFRQFSTESCQVFRRPPFLISVGDQGEGSTAHSAVRDEHLDRATIRPADGLLYRRAPTRTPGLLLRLGASPLVTTYQAGKLVMVCDEGDHLNTHFRTFQAPTSPRPRRRPAGRRHHDST